MAWRVESVMAYPFVLVEILVVINQQDTPPFLLSSIHNIRLYLKAFWQMRVGFSGFPAGDSNHSPIA
ncbi:hypothetical protein, partial [Halomonas llamarensis]